MIRLFPALVAVLALSACAEYRAEMRTKRDFKLDPTWTFQEADLEQVMANPMAYLNMHIKFRALLNHHDGNLWEAYYSGMNESVYYNLSIWPAGAKLWTPEGWGTSLPSVYVNKNNPYLDEFLAVQRFQLVTLRGAVKSDFRGIPWIELYYVNPVTYGPAYSTETLEGITRGMIDVTEKRNASAIENLEKASRGPLPDEAMFMAYLELGALYLDRAAVSKTIEDHQRAIRSYATAAQMRPDHSGAASGLKAAYDALQQRYQILEREREAAAAQPTSGEQPK